MLAALLMPCAFVAVRTGHHPLDTYGVWVQVLFVAGLGLVLVKRQGALRIVVGLLACTLSLVLGAKLFVRPAVSLMPPQQSAQDECAVRIARLENALEHRAAAPAVEPSETIARFTANLTSMRTPDAAVGLVAQTVAEATFWCPPASRGLEAWLSHTAGGSRTVTDFGRALLPGVRECSCQGADLALLTYLLTSPDLR